VEVSRRQFLRCFGIGSVAGVVTPTAALEGLCGVVAPQAKAIVSALPRIQAIEQALVSTYGMLDFTATMKGMGGLIDGTGHTAYGLAAHTNFMLGEVSGSESCASLGRLLNPKSAPAVLAEARSLFAQLATERAQAGDSSGIEDLREAFITKLSRVVGRLNENQQLSTLIQQSSSGTDMLAQRVSTWCEKLFSGRLEELSSDRLFDALRELHRMEICRDIPFSPSRQKQLLEVAKDEGFPDPEGEIYGCERAKLLRQCELLIGEIENNVVSNRRMLFPRHLINAAKDLHTQLAPDMPHAWRDFYRQRFAEFVSAAKRWNEAGDSVLQ
jgi:hypothetical protein